MLKPLHAPVLPWTNAAPQGGGGWGGLLSADNAPIFMSLASGLLSPGQDLGSGFGLGMQNAQPYLQTIAQRRRAIDAMRQMQAAGGDAFTPQQQAYAQYFPEQAASTMGQRLFPAPMDPFHSQSLQLDRERFANEVKMQNQSAAFQTAKAPFEMAQLKAQTKKLESEAGGNYVTNSVTGGLYNNQSGVYADGNGGMLRQATEPQSRAAGFADRMQGAEQRVEELMQADPKTGKIGPSGVDPTAASTAVVNALGGQDSYMHSNEYKNYLASSREWLTALLTKDSGATVRPDELDLAYKSYFPQNGEGPEVILAKQQRRQAAQDRMAAEAGVGWQQLQAHKGGAAQQGGQQPAAAAPSPEDLKKKYGLK